MKSYKENWKKLIGIGVVALAALLVLIGIGMIYHEKVKKDAGVEKKDRTDYQYHVAIISENPTDSFWKKIYQGAKDAGKGDQILIENFGETLSGEYSTEELMEMIRFVRDHFHMTILLIEHDMKLVSGICEQLTVLNFGEVLAQGDTSTVLNDPQVIKAYLGE